MENSLNETGTKKFLENPESNSSLLIKKAKVDEK